MELCSKDLLFCFKAIRMGKPPGAYLPVLVLQWRFPIFLFENAAKVREIFEATVERYFRYILLTRFQHSPGKLQSFLREPFTGTYAIVFGELFLKRRNAAMGHSRELGYRQVEHVVSLHDLPERSLIHIHKAIGIGEQAGIGGIQKDIEKKFLKLKHQQSFSGWNRLREIRQYTVKKSAGPFIDMDFNEHVTRLLGKIFQRQVLMIFINNLAKKTILKIKRENLPPYQLRKLLQICGFAGEQTGMLFKGPGFSIVMHGTGSVQGKHDLVVMREKLNVFIDLGTSVVEKKRVLHRQLFKSNRVGNCVVIIIKYEAQAGKFKKQDNIYNSKINRHNYRAVFIRGLRCTTLLVANLFPDTSL